MLSSARTTNRVARTLATLFGARTTRPPATTQATSSSGENNQASGDHVGNVVWGENNQSYGQDSGNFVKGENNIAMGDDSGNGVQGDSNIAIGDGAGNGGFKNNAVAMGTNAWAGTNSVAIGTDSFAKGPQDTALGAGATVTADHSTALGAGAVATTDHQFVMGTAADTYKAPGIVSQLSKDRQTQGKLEIVTSDQGGNLATDGGLVFDKINEFDDHFKTVDRRLDNDGRRIDENQSGVALAISMENPDLTGNERFGVAMNYGNFEGASALSWAGTGVLGYDVLSRGDRIAVSGGFGVGFAENNGDDVWGGRVGAQWTWGRKAVPYVLK